MTTTTTRPNASDSATGSIAATGAVSLQAALSDDRDTSYVSGAGGSATVSFAEPVLPTGAIVKQMALRARLATTSGTGYVLMEGFAAGYAPDSQFASGMPGVIWSTPTIITIGARADTTLTPAQVQAFVSPQVSTARLYEMYVDTTYVALPVVRVTAPADRSTVDDTNLPTISWTATLDADGGLQQKSTIRVFNAAQFVARGFDPATASPFTSVFEQAGTATSWAVDTVLPDDTYRAYVWVAQIVGGISHWSEYAFAEFTIRVDLPGEPDVVVTPTPTSAAHRIDVACDVADPTSTDQLEIQYSYNGGATWAPPRTAEGETGILTPVADAATVWDFEAPNGVEAMYRVRSLHDYSGVIAYSDWVQVAATWASEQEWLTNPYDASMALPVTIAEFPPRQRVSRASTHNPLGSASNVVVADRRIAETGSVSLMVDLADHDALDALLDASSPLLLRGAAGSAMPFPLYIWIGDTERGEGNGKGFDSWTLDVLPWVRVRRPAGGLLTVPV
jgi:hypothetical protein